MCYTMRRTLEKVGSFRANSMEKAWKRGAKALKKRGKSRIAVSTGGLYPAPAAGVVARGRGFSRIGAGGNMEIAQ